MPLSQNLRSHPALQWLAALAVMVAEAQSFVVLQASGAHLSPGAKPLLRIGSAAAALVPLVVLNASEVIIDAASMTLIVIGAGFLACLPYAPQLASELGDVHRRFIIAVIYTGVFPTAVAFLLWNCHGCSCVRCRSSSLGSAASSVSPAEGF